MRQCRRASSVGWLGCRRALSRPGNPTVVRKRVTTRILRAAAIRSCTRMSLLTAAAISGVSPGASAAMRSGVASSESSQSRSSPTVRRTHGREGLGVVRIDDQPRDLVRFVRHHLLIRKSDERQRRRARYCAATRSSADAAAMPASTSPLRSGVALASSSRRPAKL